MRYLVTLQQTILLNCNVNQHHMQADKQPTFGNGKICYLEIPSRDANESAAFYQNVFDWNIRVRSNGEVSFDDAVGQVSGTWVIGAQPSVKPSLIIHIMVFDIHKTMQLITANGGKITEDIGRHLPEVTARFADPTGNVFSIYQQPQ
jgi:predicted enzyme related to lactoylglutathione lyase